MKELILKELDRLKSEHDIEIVFAIESGSRAWGFASQDSDWDVRFVYVHKPDWYLQIDERKDSIEQILDNDIDLGGWELKKALRLLRKSNPPLLEWLQSPIVYLENTQQTARLRGIVSEYFNPKSTLLHYLHMGNGNFKDYLTREDVLMKKYFYVFRPVLACEWIRERNTMPPIEFDQLVETQLKDQAVRAELAQLLERKKAGMETHREPANKILSDYLEAKLVDLKEFVSKECKIVQPSTDSLNQIFRDFVFGK